jgi:hypothetical protein
MLMKTGLSDTAEPSSSPENFDPEDGLNTAVTGRRNVYKLEKVFEVKKEIRIRSVTLCEIPTIAGLEQT